MSEEKHICGASGFGFGARDGCPACEVVWERINAKRAASAPAPPSEGETYQLSPPCFGGNRAVCGNCGRPIISHVADEGTAWWKNEDGSEHVCPAPARDGEGGEPAPTFNEGALPAYMSDATEGEHGFQWRHVDLLRLQAGQEAVEFGGESDFRLRRLRQQRERAFDEIANLIQHFLPDRDAGGVAEAATPGAGLAPGRNTPTAALSAPARPPKPMQGDEPCKYPTCRPELADDCRTRGHCMAYFADSYSVPVPEDRREEGGRSAIEQSADAWVDEIEDSAPLAEDDQGGRVLAVVPPSARCARGHRVYGSYGEGLGWFAPGTCPVCEGRRPTANVVCDANGVIPADVVGTLAEVAYHSQTHAEGVLRDVLASHERLRAQLVSRAALPVAEDEQPAPPSGDEGEDFPRDLRNAAAYFDEVNSAAGDAVTSGMASLPSLLRAAAARLSAAESERQRFAAQGWNLGSVEEACEELERLSAMARAEVVRRITAESNVFTAEDVRACEHAAQAANGDRAVFAYWHGLAERLASQITEPPNA